MDIEITLKELHRVLAIQAWQIHNLLYIYKFTLRLLKEDLVITILKNDCKLSRRNVTKIRYKGIKKIISLGNIFINILVCKIKQVLNIFIKMLHYTIH